MPREDVPYPGAAICSIKERVEEIADEVDQKLETINGTRGNGSGNLNIVPATRGLYLTSDLVHNEVKIGLVMGDLPAAAVDSVNGQTGTVVLDGTDIQVGSGYINAAAAVSALKTQATQTDNNLLTETANRQNADAALQSNINAALATIPSEAANAVQNDATVQQLQSDVSYLLLAEAGNVKLTGSQTIPGEKTFTASSIYLPVNVYPVSTLPNASTVPASGNGTYLRFRDSNNANTAQLSQWFSNGGGSDVNINNMVTRNGSTPSPGIQISVNSSGVGSVKTQTPTATAGSTEIVTVGYVSDTGGSLNNLMHTNAAEEFIGAKIGKVSNYSAAFITKVPSIDVTNPPSSETLGVFRFVDANNIAFANIRAGYTSAGIITMNLQLRNNDGTFKYINLGTADN